MRGVVFHPKKSRVLLGLAYHRCTGRLPLFRGGPVSLDTIEPKKLPGPFWVRVRTCLAGICGSDLNLLRLQFSTRSASMAGKGSIGRPLCLGHEAVGEVIEVGSGVSTVTPGQRVVLVPGASCGAVGNELCAMCLRGLPLLCLHRDECALPHAAGAGWSEEFVRHESRLIPIPNDLLDESAVLVEPLACSVHAVLRRLPLAEESVVVFGCGVIGLGIILTLRALGMPVKIVAIARHPSQAARARVAGADLVLSSTSPDLYEHLATELETKVLSRGSRNRLLQCGASVVYDAVGSSETLRHALRWTRPRGAVVVEGITPRPAPFDCTVIWLREVDLIGSHGHGLETFQGRTLHTFNLVLEWIQQGRLATDGWITHRYPLGEYQQAMRAAHEKSRSEAGKVLLQMKPNGQALC
ncbi:MAG TPA: zinc-binding dehydrogenase [Chthoniobacteraceae bacterium]|nr:zinc-binding dehydrogenase [Chthoniobacteraceae bacterium]